METPDDPPRARTLAEKVDHLFATVHPGRRGEYSYREVAAALETPGGPKISATYLWQLRTELCGALEVGVGRQRYQ